MTNPPDRIEVITFNYASRGQRASDSSLADLPETREFGNATLKGEALNSKLSAISTQFQ
jgi:hypothetical protein